MRLLALGVVALCLLGGFHFSGQAQERADISAILERAQGSCDAGRYLEAANQLRQALRLLNKAIVTQMEGLLPEPERGWEAQPTQAEADEFVAHVGLKVRRQYVKSNSAQTVEVEVVVGAVDAGVLMRWLANPIQMERASEGSKLITIGTRRWVAKYDERDQTAELATVVGTDRVVRVRGYSLRSAEPAEKYAARVPLETLERLFR
ncbi:MAG: hypothetical protein QHJ34_10055 [bacterium]|jgi:hypothetical protein|nr:hypothetical protein [candidate division KSB1 bacterium]MDH7560560.1 hypothetical protein [bacterium]